MNSTHLNSQLRFIITLIIYCCSVISHILNFNYILLFLLYIICIVFLKRELDR